jgi:ABC-type polysaccharide/polyol phosphate transport system ATPase subunit
MTTERINVSKASIRFKMSYEKTNSLTSVASQLSQRILLKKKPHYFTALENISLTANTGEIIGVVGRNGSGKSTLLRTISGIYKPDTGSVKTTGRISALLQLGTGFNTALKGRDNIILGGLTLGLSMAQIQEQMDKIIEFAEIRDFIDTPMRYYSSGMMSRLSFAIVIAIEPDILLIDETLAVGDFVFQQKSKKAMRQMIEKASCQLIVSHELETIRNICTRAILIEKGQLIADGTPKEVLTDYQKLLQITPDSSTVS